MTISQSLFKNTVARTVSEILNRLGAALFWVFVARRLGLPALGVLAFGLSLFSIFHTVSTLGLGAVVVRDVARLRSKAGLYFGQTVLVGTTLAMLAAVLMIGYVLLFVSSVESKMTCIMLAAALAPASIFYWSKSLLCAVEQMPLITIARLGENVFKVAAGIGFLLWHGDVLVAATVIFFSKVFSAMIAFLYARRIAKPLWSFEPVLLKYLVRLAPVFSITAVTNSLFWAAPVLILTRVAGEHQAGLFGAAYKLVDVMVSFALAYGQALFPVASRTLDAKKDLFSSLLLSSVKYGVMLTLAVAAGMTMLAPHIVRFLYGAGMTEVTPILRWLIWMVVPFSMVPVLAYSLVSFFQQKYDVLANTAAAVTVIGLGFLLAPSHGALGTAWSVVAGTMVFWMIEWTSVQRKIYRFPLLPHLWKPALAALLMAGVFFLLENSNLLDNIIFAGATYVLFLLLSKALSKKELLLKHLKSV